MKVFMSMVVENGDDYFRALKLSLSPSVDLFEVRHVLDRAHQAGDKRATYAIATWYLNGNEITEVDEKKGVALLLQISDSNISEALFDLAFAYDTGRGVEKNENRAFSYYMRAALLGDREACNQISQFYAEGKFVLCDHDLSSAWRERSQQDEAHISPPYRIYLR